VSRGVPVGGGIGGGLRPELATVGEVWWRPRGAGATAEALVFTATGADVRVAR
jgi:hypothetical protein